MNIKDIGTIITSFFKPRKTSFYPLTINYEINSQCNLNCIMCNRKNFYQEDHLMDFETFRNIYDQTRPSYAALHGYGEPLLNKNLFKMINYAKSHSSKTTITSNLVALQDRGEELIDSGLDLLKVSLDTTNPETYHQIRQVDSFSQVIENLKKLIEIKKIRKTNLPEIRINFTIMKYNYKEIPEIIKLANYLGIKTILFQILLFKDIFLRDNNEISDFQPQDLKIELEKGIAESAKLSVQTNLPEIIADLPYLWYSYNKNDSFSKKNKRRCLKPWISSYISANGDVKPCDCLGLTDVVMGNIYKQNFKEIWNSKEYQEFRQAIKFFHRPNPICRDCYPLGYLDFLKYRKKTKKYLSS